MKLRLFFHMTLGFAFPENSASCMDLQLWKFHLSSKGTSLVRSVRKAHFNCFYFCSILEVAHFFLSDNLMVPQTQELAGGLRKYTAIPFGNRPFNFVLILAPPPISSPVCYLRGQDKEMQEEGHDLLVITPTSKEK